MGHRKSPRQAPGASRRNRNDVPRSLRERAYSIVLENAQDTQLRNAVTAHLLGATDVLQDGRPHVIDGADVVEYTARLDGERIVVTAARWIVPTPEPLRSIRPYSTVSCGISCGGEDRTPDCPTELRVAVSGTRRPHPEDEGEIVRRIVEAIDRWRPREMLFGGAIGADTVALRAAHAVRVGRAWPRLVVVVPGRAEEQPESAREATRRCADEVVELRLPLADKSSYLTRNAELLARADRLLAFWDGRKGGTSWTINEARRRGLGIEVAPVNGL